MGRGVDPSAGNRRAHGRTAHHHQCVEVVVDSEQALDCLGRLPEVLALNNPTLGNLELSLHIDRIDCFEGGTVVMRTCKLGALTGAVEMLANDTTQQVAPADAGGDGVDRATPRRRVRLRVDGGADVRAAANTAADPNRFAGLDEQWFWEDTFSIPEKTCWAKEHAAEVAEARAEGMTMERLAECFRKTVPTIRAALRYAASTDESIKLLPRKMPRSRWHEDHAREVAAKKAEGLGTNSSSHTSARVTLRSGRRWNMPSGCPTRKSTPMKRESDEAPTPPTPRPPTSDRLTAAPALGSL